MISIYIYICKNQPQSIIIYREGAQSRSNSPDEQPLLRAKASCSWHILPTPPFLGRGIPCFLHLIPSNILRQDLHISPYNPTPISHQWPPIESLQTPQSYRINDPYWNPLFFCLKTPAVCSSNTACQSARPLQAGAPTIAISYKVGVTGYKLVYNP